MAPTTRDLVATTPHQAGSLHFYHPQMQEALLAAAFFLLLALGAWLDVPRQLVSTSGIIQGASYTDVHARIPAAVALAVAALAGTVLCLLHAAGRARRVTRTRTPSRESALPAGPPAARDRRARATQVRSAAPARARAGRRRPARPSPPARVRRSHRQATAPGGTARRPTAVRTANAERRQPAGPRTGWRGSG